MAGRGAVKPAAGLVAWGLALLLIGSVGPGFLALTASPGFSVWLMFFTVLSIAGAACLAVGLYRTVTKIDELHARIGR